MHLHNIAEHLNLLGGKKILITINFYIFTKELFKD